MVTERATARPRIAWIDRAKAGLILLVIYGHFHVKYAPVWGVGGIYAFHVPAFLWLSGLVLPTGYAVQPFGRLWSGRLLPLIWVYLVFSLLSVMVWWVLHGLASGQVVSPLPALWGVVYGVGPQFVHNNAPLWYFPYFTAALLIAWVLGRLPLVPRLVTVLLYLILPLVYWQVIPNAPRWPWSLESVGVGVAMVMLGQAVQPGLERFAAFCRLRWVPWCVAGLLLAVLFVLADWNSPFNLNQGKLGRNFGISLINMVLGCALVALLSVKTPLPHWVDRAARTVARHVMVVFALHIFLVRAAADALQWQMPPDMPGAIEQLLQIIASLVVLMVSTLLAQILQPLLRPLLRPNSPPAQTAPLPPKPE